MSDVMPGIKKLLDSTDAIVYIDWDFQRELAKKLEVHGVPTLLIFFAGHEVGRFSGMLSAAVLSRHINTIAMHISE